jgi:hypothetical protein
MSGGEGGMKTLFVPELKITYNGLNPIYLECWDGVM